MDNKKKTVNDYWHHVKGIYPNAVFDYWFEHGELIFYKNQYMEIHGNPLACVIRNGKYVIVEEF